MRGGGGAGKGGGGALSGVAFGCESGWKMVERASDEWMAWE